MDLSKPNDKDVWKAMDVLSRAISHAAREAVAANPRGAEGDTLESLQTEQARAAEMELNNMIQNVFNKYKNQKGVL